MRLKNVLIVVKDMEQSKRFYRTLFGLSVILDDDSRVILTEGLVLQEKKVWEDTIRKTVQERHHGCELYFEERNMDAFLEKLEGYTPEVEYLTQLSGEESEERLVRLYDPDGHVIEVKSPVERGEIGMETQSI